MRKQNFREYLQQHSFLWYDLETVADRSAFFLYGKEACPEQRKEDFACWMYVCWEQEE